MAAKGLVPVKGENLVALLVQLCTDGDGAVARTARQTLATLPSTVLEGACRAALHPAILDALVEHVETQASLLEELVANRATAANTVERVARFANEAVCERIATDQRRLLERPQIIEALYKNRNTRMSTVDRIVELAARNGLELAGIASFAAHVEAIQGELIIDEPSEEPLPQDLDFATALAIDDGEEAIEIDLVDGEETVKDSHKPLAMLIADMSLAQKIRLSTIGNGSARAILVRDSNKLVAMAAISSPSMTDAEAAAIATSKQISEEVLRYIGNRREWLRNYDIKRSLSFNPKTPLGIAMRFLSHLRLNDLRSLARSKNVPASLRSAAHQKAAQREAKGG
jgi:hypothetical protein